MDRLLIALLNTSFERPDPLETPLGVVRWWLAWGPGAESSAGPAEDKPRFDAALAATLRRVRTGLEALVDGRAARLPLAFRGDASDAMLFALAHRVQTALESGAAGRVRRCRFQACGRYFADETKNGSRRWCSLRCMERARAPRRRRIEA